MLNTLPIERICPYKYTDDLTDMSTLTNCRSNGYVHIKQTDDLTDMSMLKNCRLNGYVHVKHTDDLTNMCMLTADRTDISMLNILPIAQRSGL